MRGLGEKIEPHVKVESRLQSNAKYIGAVTWVWLKFITIIVCFYTVISLLTWFPDSDQKLMQVLHHRSIITHSVLLPLLLFSVLGGSFRWLAAPLFSAVGIHLSADLLSPSIGYGAIWLPAPIKLSLGEFSKVWILTNIFLAFYFSYNSKLEIVQRSIFWATSLAGFSYGVQNEKSIISALVILFFAVSIGLWQQRRIRFDLFPLVEVKGARDAKVEAEIKRAQYQNYRRGLGFWGRTRATTQGALRLLFSIPSAVFNRPKASILTFLIFSLFVFMLALNGRNNAFGSGGSGQWVLHSSGGWILQKGGKYVGGTLTDVRP